MKIDDDGVITACSKCVPKDGKPGDVHKLAYEGDRLVCTNKECRHDWTDWAKENAQ